jgi:hypothetical protein
MYDRNRIYLADLDPRESMDDRVMEGCDGMRRDPACR